MTRTPREFTWTHSWEFRNTTETDTVIQKARAALPRILAEEDVILTGPHKWRVVQGEQMNRHSKLHFLAPAIRAVPNIAKAAEAAALAGTGGTLVDHLVCSVEDCDRVAGATDGLCLSHRAKLQPGRRAKPKEMDS